MTRTIRALMLIVALSLPASAPAQDLAAAKAAIKNAQDQLAAAAAALAATTTTGTTTTVPSGANVQAAINAAACGDTLALAAGATFMGPFTLPVKACTPTSPITITSSGPRPIAGVRVTPADAPKMAKLTGTSNVVVTAPSSHDYVLRFLEVAPPAGIVLNDLMTIGDGSSLQNTLAKVPSNVLIDQCYIHGDPDKGSKRGVALNAINVSVTNSWISGFRVQGQDSQAVGGWNGPGPFAITNNYLEAASENIIFGGGDPSIPGLIPSNITINGNTVAKPLAWHLLGGWNVKNLIELKNAAHVTITGNLFENVWSDAQAGFAVMLTVRNQDGHCPWCSIQDVKFIGNVVRHAGAFLSILGLDDDLVNKPSVRAANIVIAGNVVYDVDTVRWNTPWAPAAGRLIQVIDGPVGLTIDHNTIAQAPVNGWQNSAFTIAAPHFAIEGFIVTNNILPEGEYGIGDGNGVLGIGVPTLTARAPGFVWTGNTMILGGGYVGGGNGGYPYPAGTVTGFWNRPVLNADYTDAPGITGGADLAALKASIAGLDFTK